MFYDLENLDDIKDRCNVFWIQNSGDCQNDIIFISGLFWNFSNQRPVIQNAQEGQPFREQQVLDTTQQMK